MSKADDAADRAAERLFADWHEKGYTEYDRAGNDVTDTIKLIARIAAMGGKDA